MGANGTEKGYPWSEQRMKKTGVGVLLFGQPFKKFCLRCPEMTPPASGFL
ncbi:hypothetical protein B4135_2311 [Caldibacillus debilis]|uniref:Uncharacterized protein n=1 Tax=Caldibacillus debilis TaxID=301148 RepID=A0A150M2G7_9BACI|nr:hypothetical protein B4135_2311 [Caldibacillus debilis]